MKTIYLDHHATTPLLPQAWEAMQPVMLESFGNPSSSHHVGRRARRYLEDARELIAQLLNAHPDEVLFTSGATESNNLAVFGLMSTPHRDGSVLASPIEHPCIIEPLKHLETLGVEVDWLPVSQQGQVETSTVMNRIRESTRVIVLMLANHETGAFQPVRHVAKIRPKSIPLHCDATQAVGRIPVEFHDLDVTTLSASAHKFRGPKGIGLLLVKRGVKLQPRTFGGHQQQGRRPGTEPVSLAVGMAAALQYAVENLETNLRIVSELRSRFLEVLTTSPHGLPPRSWVVNSPEAGLPSVLNLSFPGHRADLVLVALDLARVACSTGSACSSGSLLPSPVLQAIHLPEDALTSAIRFSFGLPLTLDDVTEAAKRVSQTIQTNKN